MASADADAPVLVAVAGGVARVTLNRPRAGNAINLELGKALHDAAVACDSDDTIRCVLLTGAGRTFCAGGDVAVLAKAGDGVAAVLAELAETLHLALLRLARMAKPLLVLVNGAAAGAGFSLAMSGDIVIAARSTHFRAAYGGLGLTPDGGMSWLLPRLIGLRAAQDLILTDRRVSGDEAFASGLVTRTVDDADLETEGASAAATLMAGSSSAKAGVRRLLWQSFENSYSQQLEAELRSLVAAGGSPEAQRALAAYRERARAKLDSPAGVFD